MDLIFHMNDFQMVRRLVGRTDGPDSRPVKQKIGRNFWDLDRYLDILTDPLIFLYS